MTQLGSAFPVQGSPPIWQQSFVIGLLQIFWLRILKGRPDLLKPAAQSR
jgi:hypothetical protein